MGSASTQVFFFFYVQYIWFFFFLFRLSLSRLCVCLTSGASSPKWVQPAAEGGGLLVFYFLCFAISVVCLFVFVYIATMADGR
jgi:hypothetical protein